VTLYYHIVSIYAYYTIPPKELYIISKGKNVQKMFKCVFAFTGIAKLQVRIG